MKKARIKSNYPQSLAKKSLKVVLSLKCTVDFGKEECCLAFLLLIEKLFKIQEKDVFFTKDVKIFMKNS